MVQKSNIEKLGAIFEAKKDGQMFDDTPRGLLEALLIGGGLVATLTFAPTLIAVLAGIGYAMKGEERTRKQKLHSSFQYLRRKKYVRVIASKQGVAIELTSQGKRHAMRVHRERLVLRPVPRPRMWDKKWRLILFDIASEERGKRNAFRSFIRRIGAVMLQKSVWIYPFDCSEQVSLLRDYFDLQDEELRVVIAESIGEDSTLRKVFRL